MHKIFLVISLFILSTSFLFSQSLCDSLIIHYDFSGGQALDNSGNGYHSSNVNATACPDRYGNPNAALQFDGIDYFVEIPSNTPKPQLPISFAFYLQYENLIIENMCVFTNDYAQDIYTGVNIGYSVINNTFSINYCDGGPTNVYN